MFVHNHGQYIHYGLMEKHSLLIIEDARPKIVDALLTLIFRRW